MADFTQSPPFKRSGTTISTRIAGDDLVVDGDLTVNGSINFGDAGVDVLTIAGYLQGSVSGNTYVSIGTPATAHTLDAIDDLFIAGDLEVANDIYADGTITGSSFSFGSGSATFSGLSFEEVGTGDDARVATYPTETTRYLAIGNASSAPSATAEITDQDDLWIAGNMALGGDIFSEKNGAAFRATGTANFYGTGTVVSNVMKTGSDPSANPTTIVTSFLNGDSDPSGAFLNNGHFGVRSMIPNETFRVNGDYKTAAGTLTFTNGSDQVTGAGTNFGTDIKVGDEIFASSYQAGTVSAIADTTHLTLTANSTFTQAVATPTYVTPMMVMDDDGKLGVRTAKPDYDIHSAGDLGVGTTKLADASTTATYYVDNGSGTDDTSHGAGTGADAYRTMQFAIDQLPKYLNRQITIQMADEDIAITEPILIENFSGYPLYIQGQAGSQPTAGHYNLNGGAYETSIFEVLYCTASIVFVGLELENDEDKGYCINATYSNVEGYYMVFNNGNAGLKAQYSVNARIYGSDFTGTKRGFWLSYNCTVCSDTNTSTVTCDSYGIDCNGSTVYKNGTQPTGVSADENTSGGGQIL